MAWKLSIGKGITGIISILTLITLTIGVWNHIYKKPKYHRIGWTIIVQAEDVLHDEIAFSGYYPIREGAYAIRIDIPAIHHKDKETIQTNAYCLIYKEKDSLTLQAFINEPGMYSVGPRVTEGSSLASCRDYGLICSWDEIKQYPLIDNVNNDEED